MRTICFATQNPNKVYEIQQLLGEEFKLVSLGELGHTEELREDQETLEGNSLQKAEYVWHHYHVSCFADDSGLEVEALGGAPGVHSAYYAGSRNSDDNIALLLKNLEDLPHRRAQFRTVITLILDGKVHQFEGVVKGEILTDRRGGKGFGYDPVFVPEGFSQTFAEMDISEKNKISHRAKAVGKLVEFLKGIEN